MFYFLGSHSIVIYGHSLRCHSIVIINRPDNE